MNRILIAVALLALVSCKENPKSETEASKKAETTMAVATAVYPENLNRIFEAHGGVSVWKAQRSLTYVMPKPTGNETQTIALKSRKEKIETPDFSMGYDGKDFWLVDDKEAYKGDPIFYHNLMFYFYAMPFVLADNGIQYSETGNLDYEGKSYPGIRISYDDGVGVSSKDEYFLHYDAETNKMAWLGYTVTYRSGEKSEKVSWIRYNDWQEISGLVLPKSLTWHKVEEGKILRPSAPRNFENISLSTTEKPAGFYNSPDNAKIVTKQ